MATLKELTVKVNYQVGLCGFIEMPEIVANQLQQALEENYVFSISGMSKYPEADEWLRNNINECDCMDWCAEIDNLTL